MPVTDVSTDEAARTLTLVTDHRATPEQLWALWADADLLGRWWGPPEFPARFTAHRLEVGTRSRYAMTGPDGQRYAGYWDVTHVDAPRALGFTDGFADADGEPDASLPVSEARVHIAPTPTGTRMTVTTTFPTAQAMADLLAMGMVDGLTAAAGQIDDVLAGAAG